MAQEALHQAADSVYKQLKAIGGNPLLLPAVLQPVALLYTFQAMVDNGGFQYPMENEFPFDPPYSVFIDAYRKIGANHAANNLEKAVAMFTFPDPQMHREKRFEFFASLTEDHEFNILSNATCGDETVWILMEQYVLAHPDSFQTPESIN